MAKALHGSARPTPRLRAGPQASKESTRALAVRDGLNPKTAARWRSAHPHRRCADGATRASHGGADRRRGGEGRGVSPSRAPAVGRGVFGSRRENLPGLSRSAPQRSLGRHGISRLPALVILPPGARVWRRRPSAMGTSTRASGVPPRARGLCSWPASASPSSSVWKCLLAPPA